jgi:N-acetylglutamate synthase
MTIMNLRRLEEVSQNASRPERGAMVDGWSVGLSPSRAKRSRCVNPFYATTRSLEENLRAVHALYAAMNLPCVFRMTPFVHDSTLDAQLDTLGYARFDTTLVMTMPITEANASPPRLDNLSIEPEANLEVAAQFLAQLRGDSREEINALALRWQLCATLVASRFAYSNSERVAHALTVIEDGHVGVFDVVTKAAQRGRGIGTALLDRVIAEAQAAGVHTAYLQVSPDNPAIRLYERTGFTVSYEYWYRALARDLSSKRY